MIKTVSCLEALIKKSIPVKFSAEGTPYVDSSVSAISPRQLAELIVRAKDPTPAATPEPDRV